MLRTNRILVHLAFWVLFSIFPLLPYFFREQPLPVYFRWYIGTITLLQVVNFYIGYSALVPGIIRKKNRLFYIIVSLVYVMVFSLISLWAVQVVFRLFEVDYSGARVDFLSYEPEILADMFIQTMLFFCFAILIRFSVAWFQNQKQQVMLENQNQASELALLRMQINPHFLLNTLNNIYALVSRRDEKAPDAVIKLSEIMHYVLYKANTEYVLLENEINYLRSFIELQLLRIQDPSFVEFTISGDLRQKAIPPMLLLPFVENAFKHGNRQAASPGILIRLQTTQDELIFEVENRVSQTACSPKDDSGGIGLMNVKRRLELLYPGRHELKVNESEDRFCVILKIKIS